MMNKHTAALSKLTVLGFCAACRSDKPYLSMCITVVLLTCLIYLVLSVDPLAGKDIARIKRQLPNYYIIF